MSPDELHARISRLPPSVRKAVFSSLYSPGHLAAEEANFRQQGCPFAGTYCFFKDNFDLNGHPTTASSRFLAAVRPTPDAEGELVRKVRSLGLSIAGKTRMNEFAYGLDGANPHFGNVPHPDPRKAGMCAGGSSSGSAWTVAQGFVPLAFGTDTGGSIRVPSAFCGLFGLRLAPNSWATEGCFPLAPSFDCAGWITRTAADMKRFTEALLDLSPTRPAENLRIGDATTFSPGFTDRIHSLFPETLKVKHWTLEIRDKTEQLVDAFNILQATEALDVHEKWIDSRATEYDPAVRARILRGRNPSKEDRRKARETQDHLSIINHRLFENVDILLYPVNEEPPPSYPMTDGQRRQLLAKTVPASLARLPVLTLPLSNGNQTLGLQCILPADRWIDILPGFLHLIKERMT